MNRILEQVEKYMLDALKSRFPEVGEDELEDGGWYFCAGNEGDEYVNDPENLELWKVGSVLMYDNALNELIASPYGTAVVRVDHDRFETDESGKKMIVEKRQAAN